MTDSRSRKERNWHSDTNRHRRITQAEGLHWVEWTSGWEDMDRNAVVCCIRSWYQQPEHNK